MPEAITNKNAEVVPELISEDVITNEITIEVAPEAITDEVIVTEVAPEAIIITEVAPEAITDEVIITEVAPEAKTAEVIIAEVAPEILMTDSPVLANDVTIIHEDASAVIITDICNLDDVGSACTFESIVTHSSPLSMKSSSSNSNPHSPLNNSKLLQKLLSPPVDSVQVVVLPVSTQLPSQQQQQEGINENAVFTVESHDDDKSRNNQFEKAEEGIQGTTESVAVIEAPAEQEFNDVQETPRLPMYNEDTIDDTLFIPQEWNYISPDKCNSANSNTSLSGLSPINKSSPGNKDWLFSEEKRVSETNEVVVIPNSSSSSSSSSSSITNSNQSITMTPTEDVLPTSTTITPSSNTNSPNSSSSTTTVSINNHWITTLFSPWMNIQWFKSPFYTLFTSTMTGTAIFSIYMFIRKYKK